MITYRTLSVGTSGMVHLRSSTFKAGWDTTLDELQHEADMLDDGEYSVNILIEVDVTEREITVHDRLHAQARPATPRVAVSFDSRHGPLRYECGTFDTWRDNVRGIAKGLQALRGVERWGMGGRGEQYTGWKAIGSGIAMPAAMTLDEAAHMLARESGCREPERLAAAILVQPAQRESAYRDAAKRHHPDIVGGDGEMFKRLGIARALLQGATA